MMQGWRRWIPVGIIGVLLSISLGLLHNVTQDISNASNSWWYGKGLVYLNVFILITLVIAILTNVVRALNQWRLRQAGSRFTLRLMTGFLVLTLIPVLIVSYFSMNFIGKNVGKQLDSQIEGALDDALELARLSLSTRNTAYLKDLEKLSYQFFSKDRIEIAALLDDWRARNGAHEVLLIGNDQRFIATSVDEFNQLVPFFSLKDLLRHVEIRGSYQHLEPTENNQSLFVRVALKVKYGDKNNPKNGILTALLPVPERERLLANSVSNAQEEYKHLSFNQDLLKDAFRLALSVIVILTVLFSLWAAFIFSRRLTQPVRDLVEGTLAVASGNLQKKLPVSDRDDFSLLARSFNTMTRRLSNVQHEREQARQQLQQEHDYLYVVLEHLSSGVITLDEDSVIRRVNTAASVILDVRLQDFVGLPLGTMCQEHDNLQIFCTALTPWLNNPQEDWQTEINLVSEKGRKVLVCRGASLPDTSTQQRGYVLVFEDVTDVVQAEHDAAWSEVARRLAHEIKNPLTPIQLSAERLTRKLDKVLDSESSEFLNRMTRTIIQQVDTLKAMVNAFSDYAKAPVLVLQPINLNQLVREVVDLYAGNTQQVRIVFEENTLPLMMLDAHRIRQLLVNLVKNALEAIAESNNEGCITIRTSIGLDAAKQAALLCVKDNGPGIPPELLPQLFEPYVTSKHKGTGLGLAIVKKIVEEHHGTLSAKNLEPNGAMLTIRFPLDTK